MPRYHGPVEPGDTAGVHELTQLTVTKLTAAGTNVYVLRCRYSGDVLIVDAADDAPRILETCGDGTVSRIVTTHRHRPHWQALAAVARATGAVPLAQADDVPALPVESSPLDDGDEVRVGTNPLAVLHLPSVAGIAVLYDDPTGAPQLWTGDLLDDPALRPDDLAAHPVFARLPDETWVYPAHGSDTTLGRARAGLAVRR